MIDVGSNGIYSISNFIVNVIEIPYLAIVAIAAPIIAGAFQRRDAGRDSGPLPKRVFEFADCRAMLAFLLVWISVDDLLRLTPRYDELVAGTGVILVLGLTKAMTMSLGLSNYIIDLSPYYRFNLFNLLVTAVLNIGLNYMLIPKYGIWVRLMPPVPLYSL